VKGARRGDLHRAPGRGPASIQALPVAQATTLAGQIGREVRPRGHFSTVVGEGDPHGEFVVAAAEMMVVKGSALAPRLLDHQIMQALDPLVHNAVGEGSVWSDERPVHRVIWRSKNGRRQDHSSS
jgi:hypothetical protein